MLGRDDVEKRIREYWHDAPIMVDIAWCESKFLHYRKDGSTVIGNITRDIGVMQVNEYYHREAAANMGLDIYDLEDNLTYSRYLYDREGTVPWNSSSHCWHSRPVATNQYLHS